MKEIEQDSIEGIGHVTVVIHVTKRADGTVVSRVMESAKSEGRELIGDEREAARQHFDLI